MLNDVLQLGLCELEDVNVGEGAHRVGTAVVLQDHILPIVAHADDSTGERGSCGTRYVQLGCLLLLLFSPRQRIDQSLEWRHSLPQRPFG